MLMPVPSGYREEALAPGSHGGTLYGFPHAFNEYLVGICDVSGPGLDPGNSTENRTDVGPGLVGFTL